MVSLSYFAKCIFSIIVLWFLFLGLMSVLPSSKENNVSDGGSDNYNMPSSHALGRDSAEILKRIDDALREIHILKKNNAEMKRLLSGDTSKADVLLSEEIKENDLNPLDAREHSRPQEPSQLYEKSRRLVELDLKEMWNSVRAKRDSIGDTDMKQISEIYKQIRAHLIELRASDGYEASRDKSTEELSNMIQNRIHELQNPKDCNKAKKLICTLNKGCGFGCQVHHAGYCLVVAYATGRTLILESRGWRYNRQGWEKVFLPVSETCTKQNGESRADWGAGRHDVQVLSLPIVDFLKPRPPYLPVAIPSDIADKLETIHGEPHIWWASQFVKYLLRLQPQTKELIEEAKTKLDFASPIVGLHIRRTDKIGTEASFHNLKEYMDHAEDYYDILRNVQPDVIRKVFIASDDPNVLSEASSKYPSPEWHIVGDRGVAQSAGVSQRYQGLHGIIKDVFLLAECDLVICTFSSQVCRLAYEIMQSKRTDASQRFISLDDVYYYGGGIGVHQVAHKEHKPRNAQEIELKVGDQIGLAGNHWNGLSKGTNRRTNQMGLFPSYKARDAQQKVDFPENKWWTHESEHKSKY